MPVNSRYTSGTFTTASSLYKAAQSAKNKQQQVEDSTQKFLWDTNKISNDEYMSYAQSRYSSVSDATDKITWARNIRSVQKEINSDYRASVMLDISKTDSSTSDDDLKKLEMYANLYEQAYNDGDEDAMTSLETQYNNTFASYKKALASESRAGKIASRNTINKAYNLAKNEIDATRIQISQDKTLSPLQKAAANTSQDILEINANVYRMDGAIDSDGNIDEVKLGDIQNAITKLQGKVLNNTEFFEGDLLDQKGNIYDPSRTDYTPIVSDFNYHMATDGAGNKDFILTDKYSKVYDNGQEKYLDKETGKIGTLSSSFSDGIKLSQDSGQIDMSGAKEQTDAYGKNFIVPKGYTLHTSDTGQSFLVKVQYESYGQPETYTGEGLVEKVKNVGEEPAKQSFQMVPTGTDASGKTIFERREYDPYTEDYTLAPIAESTQKALNDLVNAHIVSNPTIANIISGKINTAKVDKVTLEKFKKTLTKSSLNDYLTGKTTRETFNKVKTALSNITAKDLLSFKSIPTITGNKMTNKAKTAVENNALDLLNKSRLDTAAKNKLYAEQNPAIAAAQKKYGESAKLNAVSPITGQYIKPKNWPAPYAIPTANGEVSTKQSRASQSILNPEMFKQLTTPSSKVPAGRTILGYANGGVAYWRTQRADGGYDVYKSNRGDTTPDTKAFKLSKADAAKELKKNLGNW